VDRPLERILLVEDEPDIQAVAQLALESIGGYKVEVADSGAEALARIDAGDRPDLILLDVMMPGLDGPGTLAALRERPAGAEVAVAFLTARANMEDASHYRRLGALGVIPKPFDPMRLAEQVAALWACPKTEGHS